MNIDAIAQAQDESTQAGAILANNLDEHRGDRELNFFSVADLQPEEVVALLANRDDVTELEAALAGHIANLLADLNDAFAEAKEAAETAR